MAEINNNAGNNRQKGGLRRCKKLSTRIDLTPMVDLGFLLITFFVFTSAISKPKTLQLYLPAGDIPTMNTGESTALTIIPLKNDRIFYYHGDLKDIVHSGLYGVTNFNMAAGIGDIIREKQAKLDRSIKFTRRDLILIIKPSPEASYQNIAAALDEVLINALKHYSLVDLDPSEKLTMEKLGIK